MRRARFHRQAATGPSMYSDVIYSFGIGIGFGGAMAMAKATGISVSSVQRQRPPVLPGLSGKI